MIDTEWLKNKGFAEESTTFSHATTAAMLKRNECASTIASPFRGGSSSGPPLTTESEQEKINVVILESSLFRNLFGASTGESPAPTWTGMPTLDRYVYLAHVKKAGVETQPSKPTEMGDDEFGIVFSHRTGPPDISSPISMVAHLISLEAIDQMSVLESDTHVALISLYSWNWTALPPDRMNFIHVMQGLGHNIQPLRAPDTLIGSLPSDTSWLSERLKAGFSIKKRTLPTGEVSASLFRGPLSPTLPAAREGVRPWSLFGTDLGILDSHSGLQDVSYTTAWQLGRTCAVGDKSFMTSLLQLRGNIHSAALQESKASIDPSFISPEEFLGSLRQTVQTVKTVSDPTSLTERGMAVRWCAQPLERPARTSLLTSHNPLIREKYMEQVEEIISSEARFDETKMLFSQFANPVNPDWAVVFRWVLGKLFLEGIPVHYIISDPKNIPPESIRTFYIDHVWVESLLDGALSLANHLNRDDDAIRRAIKKQINIYLAHNVNGKIPQMPTWGFILRSVAVDAFPELQVNAPWPNEDGRREVLWTQKIADDSVIYLFGRMPEDGFLQSVSISQPVTQQGFACGSKLDANELEIEFRHLPNQPNASLDRIGSTTGLSSWKRKEASAQIPTPDVKAPIYDWASRTLVFPAFAQRCLQEMKRFPGFSWPDGQTCPSSIIAAQLSRAAFQLHISIGSSSASPPGFGTVDFRPRKLYIPPAPALESSTVPSNKVATDKVRQRRVDPETNVIKLPTGPRSRVPAIVLPTSVSKPEDDVLDSLEQWNPPATREYWTSRPVFMNTYSSGCWPLQGTKGSPIDAGRTGHTALDLVVEIKHRRDIGAAYTIWQIEILFPIADPAFYPNSGPENAALFSLIPDPTGVVKPEGGTVLKSMWPTVEGVGRGSRWLYDTRVVQARLVEAFEHETWGQRHRFKEGSKARFFVVRARPRTHVDLAPMHHEKDASFVLRNVHVAGMRTGEAAQILIFHGTNGMRGFQQSSIDVGKY